MKKGAENAKAIRKVPMYTTHIFFMFSFFDSFTIHIKIALAPTNKSLEIDLAAGLAFAKEMKLLISKLFPYSLVNWKFANIGRTAPKIERNR